MPVGQVFLEIFKIVNQTKDDIYNCVCIGALDSILPDGSTNWGSAIMLILNGTKVKLNNLLRKGQNIQRKMSKNCICLEYLSTFKGTVSQVFRPQCTVHPNTLFARFLYILRERTYQKCAPVFESSLLFLCVVND